MYLCYGIFFGAFFAQVLHSSSSAEKESKRLKVVIIIVLPIVVVVVLMVLILSIFIRLIKSKKTKSIPEGYNQLIQFLCYFLKEGHENEFNLHIYSFYRFRSRWRECRFGETLVFDINIIRTATDDFSDKNYIGQGWIWSCLQGLWGNSWVSFFLVLILNSIE